MARSIDQQQYMMYAALLVGSLGAYGAYGAMTSKKSQGISDLFESGDVEHLASKFSDMSAKVDQTLEIKNALENIAKDTNLAIDFVNNFNSKSTTVHSRLQDLEKKCSLASTLDLNSGSSGNDILSPAIALLEEALNATKEVSYAARDKANINSGSVAQMQTSLNQLEKDKGLLTKISSNFAGVNERLDSSSTRLAALDSRLSNLGLEEDSITARITSLENWKDSRIQSVRTSDSTDSTTTRMIDVESMVDTNAHNISALMGKVDSNMVDIASRFPDFQEQISLNKSNIAAAKTLADANLRTQTDIVNPRLSDIETSLRDLESLDMRVVSRIDLLESSKPVEAAERATILNDVTRLASRVTSAEVAVDNNTDMIEGVVSEKISSNSANIDSLHSSTNFLNELLFRNNEKIICDGFFQARNGALLWNAKVGYSSAGDNNWKTYRSNTGAKGLGFEGFALRHTVGNSSNAGFIIENGKDEALLSVRASDGLTGIGGPLQVNESSAMYADGNGSACFGHWNHRGDSCGLRQKVDGSVLVGSLQSPNVTITCGGTDSLKVTPGVFQINNGGGSSTNHSVFSENDNNIVTGSGRKTYFSFGKDEAKVAISKKEITIDGTKVLATLNSLQAQIKIFANEMANNYVKTGSQYYMKGHKDNWGTELGFSGYDARWHTDNTRMKFKIFSA